MQKTKECERENFKRYHGYKVYPDGRFVKNGQVVPYQKNGQLFLTIDGTIQKIQGVRLLYSIYLNGNVPLDRKQIIIFKDGNKEHRHISNLQCISKKDYDNMTIKKRKVLDDDDVKEIRKKYKEASKQKKSDISYRKLASMYGVHHTTIQRVIKGSY